MSEAQALTSIGGLGEPEVRENGDRYYLTAAQPFTDPATLEATWRDLSIGAKAQPEDISRVVLRGVVADDLLEQLHTSPVGAMLEAAIPLGDFGHPGSNLVYFGQNSPGRQPLVSVEEMIDKTLDAETADVNLRRNPAERVAEVLRAGSIITTSLPERDYRGLHALFGPIHGWARNEQKGDQIAALGEDLEAEQQLPGSDRSKWLVAVHSGGQLVSAAMAELLTIPVLGGKTLDVVESTEWAVHPDHYRKGLAAATLSAVNAFVLRDRRRSGRRPLILAECNFRSRADLLGLSVGFTIPPREHAAQIILQNVEVGDGHAPVGYRDFVAMGLFKRAQNRYYNNQTVHEITESIDPQTA